MKYRIQLSRKAAKYLKSMDKKTGERIRDHIRILSDNPRHPELDIKKLKGQQSLFRLRIGDHRILYTINDHVLLIIIVKIGPRGDVYK